MGGLSLSWMPPLASHSAPGEPGQPGGCPTAHGHLEQSHLPRCQSRAGGGSHRGPGWVMMDGDAGGWPAEGPGWRVPQWMSLHQFVLITMRMVGGRERKGMWRQEKPPTCSHLGQRVVPPNPPALSVLNQRQHAPPRPQIQGRRGTTPHSEP